MSYKLGDYLKISVFGQSHSEEIGVIAEGLPKGEKIDLKRLDDFMQRRAPGKNRFSTARREPDKIIFKSGIDGEILNGEPLKAVIKNTDVRSGDYNLDIPRPGHADYTAYVKYGGKNDMHGGGQFSGRLTAPLCIIGGICLQLLEKQGIYVGAHAAEIHGIKDDCFDPVNINGSLFKEIAVKDFPVINDECERKMQAEIDKARENLDSVGGIIECAVTGLSAGFGGPLFEGVEGELARGLFGIPAVKGVEFGAGFNAARMYGSENNDEFYYDGEHVKTYTNNCGGILGGITDGMPLTLRIAVKPTPSVAREQKSVSLIKKENTALNINGRHDPCIVQRAVPVAEAVTAAVIYDILKGGQD